jgi:hypothetical protein
VRDLVEVSDLVDVPVLVDVEVAEEVALEVAVSEKAEKATDNLNCSSSTSSTRDAAIQSPVTKI